MAKSINIYTTPNDCYEILGDDVASIRADRFSQYTGLCSSGVNNNIVKLRGMKTEEDQLETFTYIVLPEKIEKEIYIKFVGDEEFECEHSVIESISWSDISSCTDFEDYFDNMDALKQNMFYEICSDIDEYVSLLKDKKQDGVRLSKREYQFVNAYSELKNEVENAEHPSEYFIGGGEKAIDILTKYFNIPSCYKYTFSKIASFMDQYISYFEEQIYGFIMLMDEDSVTFKPRNGKGKGKENF